MGNDNARLRFWLDITGVLVFLVGMGGAMLIYQTPVDDRNDLLEYENSKRYVRSLEAIGGKANVLADEFRRWFAGLWHGKPLAVIIACSTLLLSSGIFYAARRLSPGDHDAGREKRNGPDTGS